MSWTKADGAKIKITFSQDLTGTVTGNESHFTITVPEYDMVPEGTLGSVSKAVASTAAGDTAKELVLTMGDTTRFLNAAGNITVAYDGGGTLQGDGGPVAAFSVAFSPADLIAKNNPHDPEHIEISSVVAAGELTALKYTDTAAQDMGHIEITSITATGTLTNVHDI